MYHARTYGCITGTWHIIMVYVCMCTHQVPRTSWYFPGWCTRYIRTIRPTPSLESPSRDSLSTNLAFLEALPSLVDMIKGLYDSVWWSLLCLSRRVYLVPPHDEFSSSSSVYNPHIHIPGIICIWYLVRIIRLRTYMQQSSVAPANALIGVRDSSKKSRWLILYSYLYTWYMIRKKLRCQTICRYRLRSHPGHQLRDGIEMMYLVVS